MRLPVDFPVQACGGLGMFRQIRLEAWSESEIACLVISPYAREAGWGNDNFLYLFQPETGLWYRGLPSGQPGLLRRVPILGAPVDGAWPAEDAARSAGAGELILTRLDEQGAHYELDLTPYHLEGWELAPEVEAARSRRALARQELEASDFLEWTGDGPWIAFRLEGRAWGLAEPRGFFRSRPKSKGIQMISKCQVASVHKTRMEGKDVLMVRVQVGNAMRVLIVAA